MELGWQWIMNQILKHRGARVRVESHFETSLELDLEWSLLLNKAIRAQEKVDIVQNVKTLQTWQ